MELSGGPVAVERTEGTAVITLVRPEKKNPLSVETLDAIEQAISSEKASGAERIIITGSGGTFAAGANIEEVAALDPESAKPFGERGQQLMFSIYKSPVPVIAAIDGHCMGGALDLAVACRYRIASHRSLFAHPGPKLGIMTGWGGTQFLPRLIGRKRALGMLLTGRTVTAEEALEMGLVDRLSDDPVAAAMKQEV